MKCRLADIVQLSIAALLLAACETVPLVPSANFVGDMLVSVDYAQFFRLGPQQAGGADRSLRLNDRVMLLRKEFGYSRVQLEDGQVGYMANEDIKAAPPEPKPPRSQRKRGGGSYDSGGAQSYDDLPMADPNLNILPEDIPLEPLPDLLPEPVTSPGATPEPTRPATEPAPAAAPIKESLPESTPGSESPAPVSTST